jgi:hypothetical protein
LAEGIGDGVGLGVGEGVAVGVGVGVGVGEGVGSFWHPARTRLPTNIAKSSMYKILFIIYAYVYFLYVSKLSPV